MHLCSSCPHIRSLDITIKLFHHKLYMIFTNVATHKVQKRWTKCRLHSLFFVSHQKKKSPPHGRGELSQYHPEILILECFLIIHSSQKYRIKNTTNAMPHVIIRLSSLGNSTRCAG